MDIYTASEEAYKRGFVDGFDDGHFAGRQDAVDKIAPALAKVMRCLTCPLDCEYAEWHECKDTLKLWLKDLVEGEA